MTEHGYTAEKQSHLRRMRIEGQVRGLAGA